VRLDARLLCACIQSYEIVTRGETSGCPANPSPPPSALVGWLSPSRAYVGGPSALTEVLAGLVDGLDGPEGAAMEHRL
jgi:hypothetical protein